MSELRMPTINQVAVSGRLVQDPDYRITESGIARLNARLAVNRNYRDRDGEWQTEASFLNFVLWQKQAELFADRLHKGTPVFLSGRLRSHSWRDDEEQPHSLVEIQVRSLQILERAQTDDLEDAGELPEGTPELAA